MLDVIGVKVCYRLTVPGVCQAFIPAGTGRGETEQACRDKTSSAEAKSWEQIASVSDDAHLWVISWGHYGGQSQGAVGPISAISYCTYQVTVDVIKDP